MSRNLLDKSSCRWHRLAQIASLAILAFAVPRPADAIPSLSFDTSQIVVGDGSEIGGFTYYNTSIIKEGSKYYLLAHTGWDTTCNSTDGDQVIVFVSDNPDGPFLPRAYEGTAPITKEDLRNSALTPCLENVLWGLGDVIILGEGEEEEERFLVTFDKSHSQDMSELFEHHYAWLDTLAGSTKPPIRLMMNGRELNRIIMDPVPFIISPHRLGMFFWSADPELINFRYHYMIVDLETTMDRSGSSTSELVPRILGNDDQYHPVREDGMILQPMKNIQGGANRVIKIDGEWLALDATQSMSSPDLICPNLDRSSNLVLRRFEIDTGTGAFVDWTGVQAIQSTAPSSPLPRNGDLGVSFPTLLREGNELHFYWTEDTECDNDFGGLDLMYAPLHAADQAANSVLVEPDANAAGYLQLTTDAIGLGVDYEPSGEINQATGSAGNLDNKWSAWNDTFGHDGLDMLSEHLNEVSEKMKITVSGLDDSERYAVYGRYASAASGTAYGLALGLDSGAMTVYNQWSESPVIQSWGVWKSHEVCLGEVFPSGGEISLYFDDDPSLTRSSWTGMRLARGATCPSQQQGPQEVIVTADPQAAGFLAVSSGGSGVTASVSPLSAINQATGAASNGDDKWSAWSDMWGNAGLDVLSEHLSETSPALSVRIDGLQDGAVYAVRGRFASASAAGDYGVALRLGAGSPVVYTHGDGSVLRDWGVWDEREVCLGQAVVSGGGITVTVDEGAALTRSSWTGLRLGLGESCP